MSVLPHQEWQRNSKQLMIQLSSNDVSVIAVGHQRFKMTYFTSCTTVELHGRTLDPKKKKQKSRAAADTVGVSSLTAEERTADRPDSVGAHDSDGMLARAAERSCLLLSSRLKR